MCGYEVYIYTKQLQQIVNAWWCIISCDNESYKRIAFPNGNALPNIAKDSIELMICPYVSLGK